MITAKCTNQTKVNKSTKKKNERKSLRDSENEYFTARRNEFAS